MAIAETYFATVHLSNTINYIPTYVHSSIMTSCGGATVRPNFTLQKYESACYYCVRIESRYRYGGYVAVAAAAAARSLPLHPIHHHYLFLFYLLSELQQVNSKNTSSSLVEVKMNSAKDKTRTRRNEKWEWECVSRVVFFFPKSDSELKRRGGRIYRYR